MTAPDFSALDALLADAMAAQAHTKQMAKNRSKASEARELLDQVRAAEEKNRLRWSDPAMWDRVGTRTLIHQDGEGPRTLIGNFALLQHSLYKDAFKYQRITFPVGAGEVEYVKDAIWLGPELTRMQKAQAAQLRQVVAPTLAFEGMNEAGSEVAVMVRLRHGGIVSATLCTPTGFASADGLAVMNLPAGVDVWDCLTRETKMAIWEQVK